MDLRRRWLRVGGPVAALIAALGVSASVLLTWAESRRTSSFSFEREKSFSMILATMPPPIKDDAAAVKTCVAV